MKNQKLYIGGNWVDASSGQTFEVRNPATDDVVATVHDANSTDVDKAIDAAEEAFKTWRTTTGKERASYLIKIRDILAQDKSELAELLTKENGKPLAEALGEVAYAISFLDWFAEEARRQYGETIPSPVPSRRLVTLRQPAGVAAIITPWNFPLAMVTRKMAAALAAGCTCVVKPAEDTPLSCMAVAQACAKAGLPAGVVNVVPCSRERVQEVGAALCDSAKVAVLSFTGSTEVGKWLCTRCGQTLKKLAMELGGNAPFIVFPSADIDLAVRAAMDSKFRNTGQTCISANRIFVHESLYDEFVYKLGTAMKKELRMGNGLDEGVTLGPLVNKRQKERLIKLMEDTLAMGGRIIQGGTSPGGLYFEPTLMVNITPEMPIYKQEIFGPVAPIMKFKTEEEVVRLANDSERGLAGFFISNDLRQAWRVAEALEVGLAGVNDCVFASCEVPFGGVKHSGFGKEGSRHGLDDFSHLKLVCFGGM